MKIKHYSAFHHELGRLRGISQVIDHEKTAKALISIAGKMESLFGETTSEVVVETTKKKIKTELGAVKRPTAEQVNKKGTVTEATENAMEETFDTILE